MSPVAQRGPASLAVLVHRREQTIQSSYYLPPYADFLIGSNCSRSEAVGSRSLRAGE